jgi:hypothetical protein
VGSCVFLPPLSAITAVAGSGTAVAPRLGLSSPDEYKMQLPSSFLLVFLLCGRVAAKFFHFLFPF